jgi:hypothetical protein
VYETRVLRREEVAGVWKRLHNEELRKLYTLQNTRVYTKVSGLAVWSENCKWYSSLPLRAVVSLFYESV